MEQDETATAAEHAEEGAAAVGHTDEHATGTEVPADEGPIPLLQPAYFDNLIFWLVVSLVAIYLILTRAALPRIAGVLATRAGTVANDIAAAQSLRDQARAAETAYDKALAEARAEAGRIAAEARAVVQADLDRELAAADARIAERSAESARTLAGIEAEATASVATVARDAARAIVARLGGVADDATVDAAVARQTGG